MGLPELSLVAAMGTFVAAGAVTVIDSTLKITFNGGPACYPLYITFLIYLLRELLSSTLILWWMALLSMYYVSAIHSLS